MRNFIKLSTVFISILFLNGCGQWVAELMVDSNAIYMDAVNLRNEVVEFRKFIRRECKESLERSIEKIKQSDDTEEDNEEKLRQYLAKYYVQPITIALIKEMLDDPNSVLTKAMGCEAKPDAGE